MQDIHNKGVISHKLYQIRCVSRLFCFCAVRPDQKAPLQRQSLIRYSAKTLNDLQGGGRFLTLRRLPGRIVVRRCAITLIFRTKSEVLTRVGPDNSLERLAERSVGIVTDQPSDVYELFVTAL